MLDKVSVMPPTASGRVGSAVAMNLANGTLSKPPTIDRTARTQTGIVMARPGCLVTGVRTGPKKTRKMSRNVYSDVNTTPAIPAAHRTVLPTAELPALHRMRFVSEARRDLGA